MKFSKKIVLVGLCKNVIYSAALINKVYQIHTKFIINADILVLSTFLVAKLVSPVINLLHSLALSQQFQFFLSCQDFGPKSSSKSASTSLNSSRNLWSSKKSASSSSEAID
ncbi:hypothetical protein BpHYR1_016051 [Brachionus plicatilis]|uniref:Uncharacterized protein n=1 Tax=Brachionus plicatilis TaxID=10195 RepID=A0A3M7RRI7_BRAPC|nr:hypothetical protein BpHYR1_016051 [Brachionus plicatilis]